MMRPVLFLDLDGVLVDFVAGALRAHGKSLPPDEVAWDFCSQIGFAGADDPAFWHPLNYSFWADLGWTAEGKGLLAGLESLFGEDVALMTSPCLTPGSVEGKLDWVRREAPAYSRRVFVGPAKHLAAGPGKILLDDNDGNCQRFAEYGGRAVLAPRPWNARRRVCLSGGRFEVDRVLAEVKFWRDRVLDGG